MSEGSKTFWTQTRKRIAVSAILPVVVIAALFAFTKLTSDQIFFSALGCLYLALPFLIMKFGEKLQSDKITDKNQEKTLRLGKKIFKETAFAKIASNLFGLIILGILASFFVPDIAPIAKLRGTYPIAKHVIDFAALLLPFWVCHLYCLITDNSLSIIKSFVKLKWRSNHFSFRPSALDDITVKRSPFPRGLNYQGKPDVYGSPWVGYDD